MTPGQQVLEVYATLIAVVMPIAAVVGVRRFRRWSHAVLLAQTFLLSSRSGPGHWA